jgi:adenosylmethionine-8-amino-7-oxononanoate aminotransferase
MELLLADEGQANIARINAAHQQFAQEISNQPGVRDVRHLGTVLAVEFAVGEHTTYFSSLRDQLYNLALERHVILRPLGNIMYLMPPYCTTDEELALLYAVLRDMHQLVLANQ